MDAGDDVLRYPVGPMPIPEGPAAPEQREKWIGSIESLPARLRAAVGDPLGLDLTRVRAIWNLRILQASHRPFQTLGWFHRRTTTI